MALQLGARQPPQVLWRVADAPVLLLRQPATAGFACSRAAPPGSECGGRPRGLTGTAAAACGQRQHHMRHRRVWSQVLQTHAVHVEPVERKTCSSLNAK